MPRLVTNLIVIVGSEGVAEDPSILPVNWVGLQRLLAN
jgi:hypothetical protein